MFIFESKLMANTPIFLVVVSIFYSPHVNKENLSGLHIWHILKTFLFIKR
jgi:hypothetical protein